LAFADHVVLTDPVLTTGVGGLRRVVDPCTPRDHEGVDLVLLSHLHGDHLHLPSLRAVAADRVVVPRGAGAWLTGKGVRGVVELAPGEVLRHGALTVTGVEAEHSGHRWGPRSTRGPQAPAMGHLVEGGGHRVYAAGETDLFPGMADLGEVDLALLPVWGWGPTLGPGHLDPVRAAEAVRRIRPAVAVPVHWGTLAVPGLAATRRMRRLLTEPPHEFAAAVAADGGRTRVVVTQPGRDVRLPAGDVR
jgi:L-ascorbate metabolism protein UlaG (beta-lactamase superfamily)